MKQIPLEKLNKEELIMLIREEMWLNKSNATGVYYRERSKKNQESSELVSKEIDENLKLQIERAEEFNKCSNIDKKMKLASQLGKLRSDSSVLNKKWDKLYKKGKAIFEECYGK